MPSRDEFFYSFQRKAANLNNPRADDASRRQSLIAHVRAELTAERQAPQRELMAIREYHRLLRRLALAIGQSH